MERWRACSVSFSHNVRNAKGRRKPVSLRGAAQSSKGKRLTGEVKVWGGGMLWVWICWYFEAKTIRHTWHYSRFCRRGGARQLERLFDPNTSRDGLIKLGGQSWKTCHPGWERPPLDNSLLPGQPKNEMFVIIFLKPLWLCFCQSQSLFTFFVLYKTSISVNTDEVYICSYLLVWERIVLWPSIVTHFYSKQQGQPSVLIHSKAWWEAVGLGRRCYLLSCVCTGSEESVLLQLMEMSCLDVPLCRETQLSLGK